MSTALEVAGAAPVDAVRRDSNYAWYVAALLAVAYAVAFVDRQVLSLLVDPIRRDLGLSDVDIGIVNGTAFAVAYAAMGPVFGRLSDRGNRRNLLVFAVVLWCAFTVACGFAWDFWSLLVARAGVGAAEACLLPAAWSLLADYFTRERLPRAMSIFLMGPFVGGGLALIIGGLIVKAVAGAEFPWPLDALPAWGLTFVFVGAPGFLLAAVLLTVREPPRIAAKAGEAAEFTLRDVGRYLVLERAFYGRFYAGMGFAVIGLYALPAWTPAYLSRVHGVPLSTIGPEYGVTLLVASTCGVLLGPWIARRLTHRYGEEAPVRTAIVGSVGTAIACLALPFMPTYWSTLACSALASCFVNFALPMAGSALQASTPNRMRGLVTSTYSFVLLVVGMAIAPPLIAFVTQRVFDDPARIGVALGWVCGLAALAAVPLLLGAARRYAAMLAAARAN